jgi:hypothetical protein
MVVRKGWAREWVRAAGWMVSEGGSLLAARRMVQASRTVPDREFLSDGPIPFRRELASGRLEVAGRRALDAISGWYFKGVRPLL